MPAKDCATASPSSSSSSPAWCRSSSSAPGPSSHCYRSPPPPHICAKINAQVATNPALARPDFDFAAHVQSRSYTMHNFVFPDFEAAVLLDEGVERLLPNTFQPPCPLPSAAPALHTFEIRDAGAKGLGMFALRDIPSGALVLVEHPVIVAPYLLGMSVPLPEVYAELFGRLPPEACHELMALANSRSAEDCDVLEGIVRTNALGIQLEVPDVPHPELTTHRAVFLNTSRCNHSCGPNARWEWDTNTFALYLSAVRPILKGEEITIHYTSCTLPRHSRLATLSALYNFTCTCPSCALPSLDAISHSDATRLALAHFWDDDDNDNNTQQPSFEAWCLDAGMPADKLVKRHLAALRMIKQEGLQVLDAERHVDAIAMCYGALADLEMFRAWTGRVRDAKVHADPAQALVFAKWLSNPAAFPAWGWKKTFLGKEKEKVESG